LGEQASPLITAIIDNYNQAGFLAQAIESALGQTRPCAEIIVVDDGSTDGSREIIRSFGDRVKVIVKENGGQASALNAGYAQAQGKFVAFLDADDIWFARKIETIEAAATANPDASMIYHRHRRLDVHGETSWLARPRGLWQGSISTQVSRLGGAWACAPTSGTCFARSFLDRVMPIPREEFRISADAYLCQLAPFFGRIVACGEPLMGYRIHGGNLWNNAKGRGRSETTLQRSIDMAKRQKARLNETLAAAGIASRLHVEDDFLYLRALYAAGAEGQGFLKLALKAMRDPIDPSLAWRAAALVRLMGDARARWSRRGAS
jgi:glycosyltransferase involved in cell wall biosynthesis